MPIVQRLARRYAQRCPPWVACDDLEQAGVIGLLAALRSYDSARGASLANHAWRHARGAILDALRASDPLSRRDRARGLTVRHVDIDAAPEQFDEASDPAHVLSRRQDGDRLAAALAALPAQEHAAIAAALGEGDSQLAAQLGISSTRVVQLRRRAVGRLREAMAAG